MHHILLLLLPSLAFADQLAIMKEAQEHHEKRAVSILREHCGKKLLTYKCRVRLERDCLIHKKSCDKFNTIKALETSIFSLEKNRAAMGDSSETKTETETETETESAAEATHKISVKFDSQLMPQTTPEMKADFDKLVQLKNKIDGKQVRTECASDKDCKVQGYGHKICGGPLGTFVYSSDPQGAIPEIEELNKLDSEFQKKWMEGIYGACEFLGRTTPAVCVEHRCQ